MAGINFDGLPKDQQTKLTPYLTVGGAKTVEEAIENARDAGVWTDADDNVLNGNKNWGRTMDELAFDPNKAPEYKQLAQAKEVSDKSKFKEIKLYPSQAELDKKRADLFASAKQHKANNEHISGLVDYIQAKRVPEKEGMQKSGSTAWKWITAVALGTIGYIDMACTESNQTDITHLKDYEDHFVTVENLLKDLIKTVNANGDKICGKIDKHNADMNAYADIVSGQLSDIFAAIKSVGDKVDEKGDEIANILTMIKNWLPLINDAQNTQIEIMLKNGENFNKFANDVLTILGQIENGFLDAKDGYNKILEKMQEIEDINIDTNKVVKSINDKIGELKGGYDDSNVIAAINSLEALAGEKGSQANKFLELIYDALVSMGDEMRSYFGDMIKLAVKNGADIDDLKALLQQIYLSSKENREQSIVNTKAIIAAMEKLGVDVAGNMAEILKAIRLIPTSQQKDYSAALQAILDKITLGNESNNANFKKVLDAIEKHGAKVTVGMNAILDAIKNQPDYTERLDKILAKLDNLGDKAQEILEAIKDHDVKITVDVTGKVKCECNCNCGNSGSHEGIIGNLEELLG